MNNSSDHSTYEGLTPSNDVGDGTLGLRLVDILMSDSSWSFELQRGFSLSSPDDDVIGCIVVTVIVTDLTGQKKDVANEFWPEL